MYLFRVLISAYLFLTGYGHFLHFWTRGRAAGTTRFTRIYVQAIGIKKNAEYISVTTFSVTVPTVFMLQFSFLKIAIMVMPAGYNKFKVIG